MSDFTSILDGRIDFDPAGDLEGLLAQVPGKWVVYLFADEHNQPIQLLCVKNLRASLRRRLGGQEMIGPSKRVNYPQIVRRIYWRRVDSAFEADLVYLETARIVFPDSYRGMVGLRPAWFIHIDPAAQFPRYAKTADLRPRPGLLIGPVEDKHAAARLIELAEDAFDLCRYYNILVQAPRGKACPYKEMGKCPAPCDESISMEEYRRMVGRSARAIVDPEPFVTEQKERMARTAGELRFEDAARIKGVIEQLEQLGKGAYRNARRLEDFAFLAMQRGPWAKTAKLFVITAGTVEEMGGLIAEPRACSQLLREIVSLVQARPGVVLDADGAERVAIVTHHLFQPRQTQGVFLRLAEIDEKSLAKAWRDLQKQKTQAEDEGEGIVRELQAM